MFQINLHLEVQMEKLHFFYLIVQACDWGHFEHKLLPP